MESSDRQSPALAERVRPRALARAALLALAFLVAGLIVAQMETTGPLASLSLFLLVAGCIVVTGMEVADRSGEASNQTPEYRRNLKRRAVVLASFIGGIVVLGGLSSVFE